MTCVGTLPCIRCGVDYPSLDPHECEDLLRARKQEIFDKVAKHLLAQNRRSEMVAIDRNSGKYFDRCSYRGIGGLECALGCLITDEAYRPELEGKSITYKEVQEALRESGLPVQQETVYHLLRDLQDVHDCFEPPSWPAALTEVAGRYQLVFAS